MFAQVEQEEWNQWKSVSEEIGAGLRDVVGNTPVGQVAPLNANVADKFAKDEE